MFKKTVHNFVAALQVTLNCDTKLYFVSILKTIFMWQEFKKGHMKYEREEKTVVELKGSKGGETY